LLASTSIVSIVSPDNITNAANVFTLLLVLDLDSGPTPSYSALFIMLTEQVHHHNQQQQQQLQDRPSRPVPF
jgi:hypothetical protein